MDDITELVWKQQCKHLTRKIQAVCFTFVVPSTFSTAWLADAATNEVAWFEEPWNPSEKKSTLCQWLVRHVMREFFGLEPDDPVFKDGKYRRELYKKMQFFSDGSPRLTVLFRLTDEERRGLAPFQGQNRRFVTDPKETAVVREYKKNFKLGQAKTAGLAAAATAGLGFLGYKALQAHRKAQEPKTPEKVYVLVCTDDKKHEVSVPAGVAQLWTDAKYEDALQYLGVSTNPTLEQAFDQLYDLLKPLLTKPVVSKALDQVQSFAGGIPNARASGADLLALWLALRKRDWASGPNFESDFEAWALEASHALFSRREEVVEFLRPWQELDHELGCRDYKNRGDFQGRLALLVWWRGWLKRHDWNEFKDRLESMVKRVETIDAAGSRKDPWPALEITRALQEGKRDCPIVKKDYLPAQLRAAVSDNRQTFLIREQQNSLNPQDPNAPRRYFVPVLDQSAIVKGGRFLDPQEEHPGAKWEWAAWYMGSSQGNLWAFLDPSRETGWRLKCPGGCGGPGGTSQVPSHLRFYDRNKFVLVFFSSSQEETPVILEPTPDPSTL